MTRKQARRNRGEIAADALLARLDARRSERAALDLSRVDSTEIPRELREHVAR